MTWIFAVTQTKIIQSVNRLAQTLSLSQKRWASIICETVASPFTSSSTGPSVVDVCHQVGRVVKAPDLRSGLCIETWVRTPHLGKTIRKPFFVLPKQSVNGTARAITNDVGKLKNCPFIQHSVYGTSGKHIEKHRSGDVDWSSSKLVKQSSISEYYKAF
ncbi:uncharacterized protein LOC116927245 isoform X2 [Daphnia magna]|uniref:uncharacterized protein LOC116927245 isoform X2 n=1 Tax=Daphnia magna TaxID=35525 RepID=UPI001E1BAACE|nr:uncharacterized protein LOC116927245 isoform X2 [Daphnia magna]